MVHRIAIYNLTISTDIVNLKCNVRSVIDFKV